MESLSVVKRNIVANVFGGVWVLGLGLLLVLTQFKILGSEVVGLLGFVAALQLIFSIFDFGLAPTILREVASDSSPEREISRELIQAISFVYWFVAALLGIGLALAANWLTQHWITLIHLTQEYATRTIQILALRLFLGWPLIFYINVLSGIQRLDIVNVLRVFTNTLSIIGGIVALLVWRDLHIFLWWTVVNSGLSLVLHIIACYRYFPKISLAPRFSRKAFQRIWRFSLDMNLLSTLTVLYTQADSLLVSYLLPLKTLGYYDGAYSLNQKSTNIFVSFFSGAMLPTLAEDFGQNRIELLKLRFQKYSQILTYTVVLPTFILIFWGYDVLRVWTTLEVAENAQTALAILSVGFFLNATMSTGYILAVATGYTRIPLYINLIGVGVYLPILYMLIIHWGINGAAVSWLLLNLYYVFTFFPLTQIKILKANPFQWVVKNMLPFMIVGLTTFGIGRTFIHTQHLRGEIAIWGICAISVIIYMILGFVFLDAAIRQDIQKIPMRIVARRNR